MKSLSPNSLEGLHTPWLLGAAKTQASTCPARLHAICASNAVADLNLGGHVGVALVVPREDRLFVAGWRLPESLSRKDFSFEAMPAPTW